MGLEHERGRVVTDNGWPDRAIAEIAGRQQTLIVHAQLLSLGVGPRAVSRAVARGRLHRVHRGVYSLVVDAVRPPRVHEFAAVLIHGEIAVLSHQTAAALHGIPLPGRASSDVHVTLIAGRRRGRRRGIVLHSSATLGPSERHRLRGLPLTSVARTVIDLSPQLTPRQRERLVDDALSRGMSRAKLTEALDRHPGRPGTPALRALLDPARLSSLTASPPEERLLMLIRKAGLPAPEANVPLSPSYTPDLLWRRQRVIVEFDSHLHHSGRAAFHSDRTRHNRLEAEGYRVLHVTIEHLQDHPEEVLVWIAQALVQSPAA